MWDRDLEGPALEIAGSASSPLLVAAGPGTGKTYSLMRRIWRLLDEGCDPEKVFVGTFTRTSATDLRKSLNELGVQGVDAVYAGTLHSFCFSLLSKDEVFAQTQRVPRPLLKFEERFLLEDLVGPDFGGIRQRRSRLSAFNTAWARLHTEEPGWLNDPVDRAFHGALMSWLEFHRAMHIGELIWLAYAYLRDNPGSEFRSAFQNVLVDEYQDLNRAEQVLLELLAERGTYTVIGDEDQSIYSFRYAHPDGMRQFAAVHEGTDAKALAECRRCPRAVVAMANELISRNRTRADRRLTPFPGNPEGEVCLLQWSSIEEEADGIARIIRHRVEGGQLTPGDILVLSPRRQLGYAVRDALNRRGVPAHSFFAEEELDGDPTDDARNQAQQAYALLCLKADPEDQVALRCWCGFGSPSLRSGAWARLRARCDETGQSARDALARLLAGTLSVENAGPLVERQRDLEAALARLDGLAGQALVDALFPGGQVWAEPLRAALDGQVEDDADAQAVLELLKSAVTQPELPTDVDYVRVMSLHKSKGLTAKFVVVTGCIDGLIPTIKTGATPLEQAANLEEQRRLFYVAVTRAKESLFLSGVTGLPSNLAYKMRARTMRGRGGIVRTIASRFLAELGGARPNARRGAEYLAEHGL